LHMFLTFLTVFSSFMDHNILPKLLTNLLIWVLVIPVASLGYFVPLLYPGASIRCSIILLVTNHIQKPRHYILYLFTFLLRTSQSSY
jgi:hypothetical protein